MPCYSTVRGTQMVDRAQLESALRALGYDVSAFADSTVVGRRNGYDDQTFVRPRVGAAYESTTGDLSGLQAVQRKYSELAVRELARRKGYSVVQEGRKLTLINRRGGK
jgi:hypothetical protein